MSASLSASLTDITLKARPTSRPAKATAMPARAESRHELVAEEPVAMVFDGTSVAVMMASPSDIEDFAVGFALTEGFVGGLADIKAFEPVTHPKGIEARIWLREERSDAFAARRRSMAGPVGCGLCGLESLDQACRSGPALPRGRLCLSFDDLNSATRAVRA
ncbi:MAG: formate dehydrogenase accessory sulfurtransferase FdhD, partial [Pseudomonadota bacterium]